MLWNLLDDTTTVTKRQPSMPVAGTLSCGWATGVTRSYDSINTGHSNAHYQTYDSVCFAGRCRNGVGQVYVITGLCASCQATQVSGLYTSGLSTQ